MRPRVLLPFLALAAASCARDLEMPSSSPPRVDSVQVLGLEASTPPVPLPVLGGELVAIHGGGFPADTSQLELQIGGVTAQVLDLTTSRIVARVPALGAFGATDLTIRSPVGFRTQAGALLYDGAGQPGSTSTDAKTSVALGFVTPLMPPTSAGNGFPNLAVAIGASDSALVVLPSGGVALTTVPLGIVPSSAAARLTVVTSPTLSLSIQVLALGRSGEATLGQVLLDPTTFAVTSRAPAKSLPPAATIVTKACSNPQVIFTSAGAGAGPVPVAAWKDASGVQQLATIDTSSWNTATPAFQPASAVYPVSGAITGWAPWSTNSIVFAAGNEIWVYDAAGTAAPAKLVVPGTANLVSALLNDCATPTAANPSGFYALTAAYSGGSQVLAAAYRAGGSDWVAIVDLTAAPGTVWRGHAGTLPTSLALVPNPPYATTTSTPPIAWTVLVSGLSELYRFGPLSNPGNACGTLVANAALPFSVPFGYLPPFGGMTTTDDGTRVLSTTPDGDLVTILPPSLTSAGSVLRVASYGALSLQQATIGGASVPVVVAEHALTSNSLSALDTGSSLLVVSLAGDQGSVALGGSGYGRGAAWLDPSVGGALAYTGDLSASTAMGATSGAAAAVIGFTPGVCPGEAVHISGSRPAAGGLDLIAQGPARSGLLGPDGVARWGPAAPPVYGAKGTILDVFNPTAATLSCLAGTGTLDWSTCTVAATIPLGAAGVVPLDVVLATGDRAVAARSLDLGTTLAPFASCTQATGFSLPAACGADLLCLRASCPPARSLQVSKPGATAATAVSLPTRPQGVAADRGGGFLVTLPCSGTATTGSACFGSSSLCPGLVTSAGGPNGALVLVAEDGSSVKCLAVLPGLNGPVAITPNGAEAWVVGHAAGLQVLSRIALARRTADGAIDTAVTAARTSLDSLGVAAKTVGSFPVAGVTFTPDGGTGVVSLPGQFKILLYQ